MAKNLLFKAKIYPQKIIFYTDNIRASVTNCMSAYWQPSWIIAAEFRYMMYCFKCCFWLPSLVKHWVTDKLIVQQTFWKQTKCSAHPKLMAHIYGAYKINCTKYPIFNTTKLFHKNRKYFFFLHNIRWQDLFLPFFILFSQAKRI